MFCSRFYLHNFFSSVNWIFYFWPHKCKLLLMDYRKFNASHLVLILTQTFSFMFVTVHNIQFSFCLMIYLISFFLFICFNNNIYIFYWMNWTVRSNLIIVKNSNWLIIILFWWRYLISCWYVKISARQPNVQQLGNNFSGCKNLMNISFSHQNKPIGIMEVTKDESEILIISSLVAGSFLICLVYTIYHRRKRRKHHHRQLGLRRSGGHYDSTTSATGEIRMNFFLFIIMLYGFSKFPSEQTKLAIEDEIQINLYRTQYCIHFQV